MSESPPPAYSEVVERGYSVLYYDPSTNKAVASLFDQTGLNLNEEELLAVEMLNEENKLKIERELYVIRQLKHNYPIRYLLVDSALLIVCNLALIVLQIVAMQTNAALSQVASGVWAGLYNITVVGIVLLTIKHRSPLLVSFATTLKLFGMIISFACFILINTVALYNYACFSSTLYECYNSNMKPLHYAMIALGLPSVCQSVAFFIYFQFKLMGNMKTEFRPADCEVTSVDF